MTFTRGLFIHPDSTRGTTALEARQALAGLITSAGVLDGLRGTGTSGWQYRVGAGHVATSRDMQSDGLVLFGNDAPVLVNCSPAPGTGSRIDVVYAKHNDATTPNADPNSEALAGVAEGIASGSPVAPTLPAGAVELFRATMGAGATNTNHANVTISHAEQTRAGARGSIVTVADTAQRDATLTATDHRPLIVWRESGSALEINSGSGWQTIWPQTLIAGTRTGSTTQSVPNDTTTTIGQMLSSDGTMPNAPGGGLTAPVAGRYAIKGGIRLPTASGRYQARLIINGSTVTMDERPASSGNWVTCRFAYDVPLSAGAEIYLAAYQDSGSALTSSVNYGYPFLSAALLGQG